MTSVSSQLSPGLNLPGWTPHQHLMRVAEIWCYPIKSFKGQRLQETQITPVGIPSDRKIVVVRSLNGRILTSRVKPRMLGLEGGISADGIPTINGFRWDSGEALRLVTEAAGEAVTLERLPAPQAFHVLPVLVAPAAATQFIPHDHLPLRPTYLHA